MLRKKNKLPADVHSIDFELEYGTATIEVHKDSIDENDADHKIFYLASQIYYAIIFWELYMFLNCK